MENERDIVPAGYAALLARNLKSEFPEMRGFSRRNLKYMRAFAATWPDQTIVHAPLAQITWYHNIALLERLGDPQTRFWYASKAMEHGWSRNIMALEIEIRPHDTHKPMGVATYRTVKRLPKELKGQLPKPKEIAKLLEEVT
jgi:predicted nuclease of restriction endonuclease-like (RecB) superfamily